jgi:hypothetical protein
MESYRPRGVRVPCTYEHAVAWGEQKLAAFSRVHSRQRPPGEIETEAIMQALTRPDLCGGCRYAAFFTVAVAHTAGSRIEMDCAAGANIVGVSQGKFLYEVCCPLHCQR